MHFVASSLSSCRTEYYDIGRPRYPSWVGDPRDKRGGAAFYVISRPECLAVSAS